MAMKNMGIGNSMKAASQKPSPYAAKPSIPVKGGGGVSGTTKLMASKAAASLKKQSKGRDGRS